MSLRSVVSALLLLILLCLPAHAGQYSVAYSGGLCKLSGNPYTLTPSGYGGFDGQACSGAISTAYTWQPASGQTLATDPPPSQVIIAETCTITVGGGTAAGQTASYDTGLGQSGSVPYPTSPQGFSVTSVRYFSQAGGSTVTLPQVSPSASTSYNGWLFTVYFTAAIFPVTVSLGGTQVVGGVQDGLTGQQITATVNGIPSGFTVTKYSWRQPSSNCFKTYDPTLPSNQLVPLGSADLNGPMLGSTTVAPFNFYDRAAESLTVSCTVTLLAPDGKTTLSIVAAAPRITMEKPTASWTAYSSGPFINISGGYGTNEYWNPATITLPLAFTGTDGLGCFAQLITPSRQATRSLPAGTPMVYAATYYTKVPDGNGGWTLPTVGLDTAFPYPFGTVATSGAQVSSNYTWDVSSQGDSGDMPTASYNPAAVAGDIGGTNWYTATIQDSFTTWIMYKPTGGVWVPLQNLSWSTNITVSDTTGPWAINVGSTVTTPASGSNDNEPPTWTKINNASQGQMRP